MRLSDLETLAAVIEEGSLSAAARRLFLTQPAVSARLRQLERAVGEPLLRRSGRGVTPTPAGLRLRAQAERLLEEVRRLRAEVTGAGPLVGPLAIGATDLVAIYHLPAVLRRFRARHPRCELAVHIEGTAALVRLLSAGRCDLAFGTLPVAEPGIEAMPLFRDPLALVAPADHPLGRKRRPTPTELGAEVWIGHKPDSVTRRQVEAYFDGHGVRLRVTMEISSPEAIKKLVQARLGLAALPWCSVRQEVREGRLRLVNPRDFRLERCSGLLVRQGLTLGRAAAAFRALLGPGPVSSVPGTGGAPRRTP